MAQDQTPSEVNIFLSGAFPDPFFPRNPTWVLLADRPIDLIPFLLLKMALELVEQFLSARSGAEMGKEVLIASFDRFDGRFFKSDASQPIDQLEKPSQEPFDACHDWVEEEFFK